MPVTDDIFLIRWALQMPGKKFTMKFVRFIASFFILAGLVACSAETSTETGTETAMETSADARSTATGADLTDASSLEAPSSTEGPVVGTIKGTEVTLSNAEFDGQLAIFEGDGWGWNPSLLIFLFLDEGIVPEGQTFEIDQESSFGLNPHIHYRWRATDAGGEEKIETEIAVNKYEMKLVFGNIEGDELPGTITFSVLDEDTNVSGTFRAKLKGDPAENVDETR